MIELVFRVDGFDKNILLFGSEFLQLRTRANGFSDKDVPLAIHSFLRDDLNIN